MTRRSSASAIPLPVRLLALALALMLCPLALPAPNARADVEPFSIMLWTTDADGQLVPLTDQVFTVDPTNPRVWLTLPAGTRLDNIIAQFITSDGSSGMYMVDNGSAWVETDPAYDTDFTMSGEVPKNFYLRTPDGYIVFEGQLTISYQPAPDDPTEFPPDEPSEPDYPDIDPPPDIDTPIDDTPVDDPPIDDTPIDDTPEEPPEDEYTAPPQVDIPVPEFPAEMLTSDYARIGVNETMLRAAPNGDVLYALAADDTVWHALDYELGSDNKWWALVQYGDVTGYVPMLNLSYLTEWEADEYLNPQPTPSPEPEPTDEPPPEFPASLRTSDYARINIDNTILCAAPNGSGLYSLAADELVWYALDYALGSDNQWWAQIQYGDTVGYVPMVNLRYLTQKEAYDYLNPTPAPPTQTPEPQPTSVPDPTFPPGIKSSHAKVDAIAAPFYTGPGDGTHIGELYPDGTIYKELSRRIGSDMEWWIEVEADGQRGYVPLNDLKYLTPEEEYKHLHPTATATATATATVPPSPSAAASEPTPVVPTPAANERASGYAYVTKNAVNIRSSATTDSTVVAQVAAGNVLFVNRQENSGGVSWSQVQLDDGRQGYIRSDMLRIMTQEEEEAYLKSIFQPPTYAPTMTASPIVTAAPIVTSAPTAPPPQISGYARIITQGAPMLNWPNIGAAAVEWLNYSAVIYVQEQVYPEDGSRWHFVMDMDNGKLGYVLSNYVQMMTPDEVRQYFQSQVVVTPAPAPTSYLDSFSGFGVTSVGGVNFRAAPGGSSKATLTRNTIVRLIDSVYSDGYTWYQAEVGGMIGYLREDVVRLLTVTEYLSVLQNPSYNNGTTIVTPTLKPSQTDIPIVWTTPSITNIPSFVTPGPTSTGLPTATPWATKDPNATLSPWASPSASASVWSSASPRPSLLVSPAPSPSLKPSASPTLPVSGGGSNGGSRGRGLLLALVILIILVGGGLYGFLLYNRVRKEQLAKARMQRNAQAGRSDAVQRGAAQANPGAPKSPAPSAVASPQRPNPVVAAMAGGTASAASARTPSSTQPGRQASTQRTPPPVSKPSAPPAGAASTAPQKRAPGIPPVVGTTRSPSGSAQANTAQAAASPYAPPPAPPAPNPIEVDDSEPVSRRPRSQRYGSQDGTAPQPPVSG